MDEIARICHCSVDTLERRFMDEIEFGRADAKSSLKRKQFEVAMSGSVPMLIWLGKVWMNQREPAQVIEHQATEVKPQDVGLIANHLRTIKDAEAS